MYTLIDGWLSIPHRSRTSLNRLSTVSLNGLLVFPERHNSARTLSYSSYPRIFSPWIHCIAHIYDCTLYCHYFLLIVTHSEQGKLLLVVPGRHIQRPFNRPFITFNRFSCFNPLADPTERQAPQNELPRALYRLESGEFVRSWLRNQRVLRILVKLFIFAFCRMFLSGNPEASHTTTTVGVMSRTTGDCASSHG